MDEVKSYTLDGLEYHSKPRYSLRVWGEILSILQSEGGSITGKVIDLISTNALTQLLNLILDKPITGELYEDDFPVVSEILNDFFSRKKSLIHGMTEHSKG